MTGATLEALRSDTRRFVDAELAPHAAHMERAQEIPPELLVALAERGLFATAVPRRFGGEERSAAEELVIHEEVARGHASLENLLTVSAMAAAALRRSRAEAALAAEWLPALAKGERLLGFALTEPHAGSSLKDARTRVEPRGDELVLHGEKTWISFAGIARAFVVLARAEGDGMAAVLVERDAPGLTITPIQDMLGLRANTLGHLHFDGCRVPGRNLLQATTKGLPAPIVFGLDAGRFRTACGSLGLAQGSLDVATRWARERASGGAPLYGQPLVQKMLAESVVAVRSARALCEAAAAARDRGDPDQLQATLIAKYQAARSARVASDHAVQIMGAAGCHASSPVERWFREARLMELIEGTSQVHEALIAMGHVHEASP